MFTHHGRGSLIAILALAAVSLLAACEDEGNGAGDVTTPDTTTPTQEATPADGQQGSDVPTATPTDPADPVTDQQSVKDALRNLPALGLEVVAEDLTAPVHFAALDDGSGRLFIVEQTGRILVVSADGQVQEQPFLDVRDRMVEMDEGYTERGLLGLAFHPDYSENGRFFVYYSAPLAEGAPDDWDHTSHLSEFRVSEDDENVADPNSEQVILAVDQPQSNHNGGHITFGEDGYLFVPLGDGGAGNDVALGHTEGIGNAQDRSNLLGSILRIDVDTPGPGGQAYAIPEDNPFVDQEDVRPEIWAYGVRNPYDISVDRGGEYSVLVSDAGQELFEEVSIAQAGDNLGWNIREGTHCFDPDNPEMPPEECPTEGADGEPLVGPVIEYHRDEFGTVVTGAYIYRGSNLSEYEGMLLFAEWNTGEAEGPDGALFVAQPADEMASTGVDEGLWPFVRVELNAPQQSEDTDAGGFGWYITGIGADADGELYLFANREATPVEGAGAIFRLVPADGAG